jgi:hypothetical protein
MYLFSAICVALYENAPRAELPLRQTLEHQELCPAGAVEVSLEETYTGKG